MARKRRKAYQEEVVRLTRETTALSPADRQWGVRLVLSMIRRLRRF